jgi:2-polyprenyl-3-methyl-5-hydroxy-6-metoxy-1,4-benzoquinol methylase
MGALSEDDRLPLATTARELVARGPQAAPPGTGRLRRLARRVPLRLVRSFSRHQQQVNEDLVAAVESLDARVRAQERLQLGAFSEDVLEALDALNTRVAASDEVVAGARALPYTEGDGLQTFRHPRAGVVLGFHAGGEPAASLEVGFAEVFRGSEDRVRERQRGYVELLAEHAPVLDAGCGRGELLDLLRELGIHCTGVDSDPGMVEHCRAKGHDVEFADANEHLERLEPASLGAVFSAQFVEHLSQTELVRFLENARARLRTGGLFVAETVNAHAPHALKCFWVDPTHRHPLFPETLLVLCRLVGFADGYAFHPLGTRDVDADRYRESEYAVVATAR